MSASAKPPLGMTVDEFLAWSPEGDGRYELRDGAVVAMAPPTADHARVIRAITRSLEASVASSGLPCEVFQDSLGVRVDATTMFIPDVVVNCGQSVPGESREAVTPVVVVDVASPSTRQYDAGRKLIAYSQVDSIRHYLIVVPDIRRVIQHRRGEDGAIIITVHGDGPITLDPPGFVLLDLFPSRQS